MPTLRKLLLRDQGVVWLWNGWLYRMPSLSTLTRLRTTRRRFCSGVKSPLRLSVSPGYHKTTDVPSESGMGDVLTDLSDHRLESCSEIASPHPKDTFQSNSILQHEASSICTPWELCEHPVNRGNFVSWLHSNLNKSSEFLVWFWIL